MRAILLRRVLLRVLLSRQLRGVLEADLPQTRISGICEAQLHTNTQEALGRRQPHSRQERRLADARSLQLGVRLRRVTRRALAAACCVW